MVSGTTYAQAINSSVGGWAISINISCITIFPEVSNCVVVVVLLDK